MIERLLDPPRRAYVKLVRDAADQAQEDLRLAGELVRDEKQRTDRIEFLAGDVIAAADRAVPLWRTYEEARDSYMRDFWMALKALEEEVTT